MRSLFSVNFNWPAYLFSAILIRLIFFDISWYSWAAIMISIYQFMLLFNSISHIIPIRYLLGSFMCVQFFLGPTFAYNGLDKYQYMFYIMRVPEEEYFSYVIPAVLAFIAGLHITAGRLKGEYVDQKRIATFVDEHPQLPYLFIILGFSASLISVFFSAEIAFVFYLLGSFKFIGLFLLILGSTKLKLWSMMLVIGSIVTSSFASGMFHDLFTWIIFTAAVFALRYKFDFKTKLIGAFSFIILAATVQVMKGSYRSAIKSNQGEAGLEMFTKLAEEKNEQKGLFNFKSIAESNVRINQGFIITNIMITVPAKVPFARGEQMWQLFEAGLLPRLIAPNKLKAGDRGIFVKYSGLGLTAGTSMGLSSIGDAYINWGVIGGIIFMFFYGLMFSTILNIFNKHTKEFPILVLFSALVFYYPIRPDCELQTILGHLFKSIFLIWVILLVWRHQFTVLMKRKPVANVAGETT